MTTRKKQIVGAMLIGQNLLMSPKKNVKEIKENLEYLKNLTKGD